MDANQISSASSATLSATRSGSPSEVGSHRVARGLHRRPLKPEVVAAPTGAYNAIDLSGKYDAGLSLAIGGTASRGFERTSTWVFDLDNTLYPAECDLFAQVDRRMGEYVAKYLGVPYEYARHLQKSYYRQFGTTLSGLMQVHRMDPKPFLDYVHDIDLTPVQPSPELAAAIDSLPGRKLIFTNGSVRHAENVATKLGVLHLFEGIHDIVACEYVPKPHAPAYAGFVKALGVAPETSAMFEDMPHNLEQPHALGMTTVLVHSSYMDHPIQQKIKGWTAAPDHIHHMTEDLIAFLDELNARLVKA